MDAFSTSFVADSGGKSQKIAISGTSASTSSLTPPLGGSGTVSVTVDTNAFMRQGAGALADGTDRLLLANVTYRVTIGGNGVLSFITSGGTGNAYVTREW